MISGEKQFGDKLSLQMLCPNDCLQLIVLNSQRKEMIKKLFAVKGVIRDEPKFELLKEMAKREGILETEERSIIEKYHRGVVCSLLYRKAIISFCKNALDHKSERFISLMSIKELQRFSTRKKQLIEEIQVHISHDFVSFSLIAQAVVGLYRHCLLTIIEELRQGKRRFLLGQEDDANWLLTSCKSELDLQASKHVLPNLYPEFEIKSNKLLTRRDGPQPVLKSIPRYKSQ
jgi:hypothetical protein